jgi:nitrate reductase NapE component
MYGSSITVIKAFRPFTVFKKIKTKGTEIKKSRQKKLFLLLLLLLVVVVVVAVVVVGSKG